METLNEIVDQIYCINLDKRSDRWAESSALFSKMRFSIKRVPGLEDTERPWNGLRKTVIGIFKEAISNGHERILILEDDIDLDEERFYEDFHKSYSSLPEDWDMFYFSAAHQHWPVEINEFLFRLTWSTAAHAIVFNKKSFELILNALEDNEEPIDVIYSRLQKWMNAYCSIEPLAWQRKSYSDIEGEEKWYPYLQDIGFYEKYKNGLITIDGKEIPPPSGDNTLT